MGIFRSFIRFFTGKTEEDDDEEEESERSPYRNHLYRTLPRLPGQNVHRTPYGGNSPSNLSSSENPPNKMLSIFSFIYRPLKFIFGKLFWPISLLRPQKSHDQTLPVDNPKTSVTFYPSLSQNLLISSPGNNSIKKPPLKTAPAPAKPVFAPVKTSPLHDPQHHLTCKNCPVFSNAIFAPVKISPLNDPPRPLSYKNAVIKSLPVKSGQPDRVTVSVPKFTASLAYTTADKAIRASSVLPKTFSVKSEPKKGNEEVKKEVVVIKKTMAVHEGRWIKHYSSRHRILLVGDGDFSFSACLATAFGCAPNVIATSLDSKEFLMKNYNKAESNLKELKKRQCKVLHGIDATKMAAHELLGSLHFDRIIFNFPFAGFFKTLSRDTQLRRHRKLVSEFLKNAKEIVSENGEIHISHKTNGFHVEWNLESMASSHRLILIEAMNFSLDDYPGYNTKCGFWGDNNFECNPSKTYKFGIKWVRS